MCTSGGSVLTSSMSAVVKSGKCLRYKKKIFGKNWQEVRLTLQEDSTLSWYNSDDDPLGRLILKNAPELIAASMFCSSVPNRPDFPDEFHLKQAMAIASPNKSETNWFLFYSEEKLAEWMTSISRTLPPPPNRGPIENSQQSMSRNGQSNPPPYTPNTRPPYPTNIPQNRPPYPTAPYPSNSTVPYPTNPTAPYPTNPNAPYPNNPGYRQPQPHYYGDDYYRRRRRSSSGSGSFLTGLAVGGALGYFGGWGMGYGWGVPTFGGYGYGGFNYQDTDIHIHNETNITNETINNYESNDAIEYEGVNEQFDHENQENYGGDFDDGGDYDFGGDDFGGDDFGDF